MRKIFTLYQTNKVNILGGYMTYHTLSEAFDALNPKCGVNTITGYLCEVLSKGVIYRA